MQPDTHATGADKSRAVQHYTAMAAQAARTRRPDLYAITGWQYDRRRALALLRHQEALARNADREVERDTYWSAAYDIELILRERAVMLIEESTTMRYATVDYLGRPWASAQ